MALSSALDLLRRLPPKRTADTINDILDVAGEAEWTEDFLGAVDAPLRVQNDPINNTPYLLCDYNRDGDSYRSPWSNAYDPPIEDGALPSERMRAMEVNANEVFNIYRELYFEGGASSVYMWEVTEHKFAAAWLIKKVADTKRGLQEGGWDGIHVFEVQDKGLKNGTARYKLTSTIIISMGTESAAGGSTSMSGSTTKQVENDLPFDESVTHVINMGTMLEAMETALRLDIQGVCFDKTQHITDTLHSCVDPSQKEANARQADVVAELTGKLNS